MLVCETLDAWTQFLGYVKDRCSATAFGNWLAPIVVLQASEQEIILEVPNIFVQDYLLSNYKRELLNFLPATADGQPAVTFVISQQKKEIVEKTTTATPPPPICAPESNFYDIKLNNRYRFSTFIEGSSNQFIKSAALGVANRPGQSYNPLFIHGGVGLGKTHILHSIGHHVAENQPKLKIQVITTEGYINDLVENLRRKTGDKMKRFYRTDVDLLLIDDIQFLQNRLNFEEEFCILLEHFASHGKQVVLTSDKPPSHLKLSERMKARLEWGLVAHMGIPDLETRVAILKNKSEQKGIDIQSDIAFFIAEQLQMNVRQLEGAINRLNAHSRLLNVPITKELVINTLGEMFQQTPKEKITVDQILSSVATIFQVRVQDLKSASRLRQVAVPRQVAMYLSKMLVNDSLMSLGVYFHKTHSTILHACKTIEQKMKLDEMLKRQVDLVRRSLEQG